jgi:hypothetical protein
MGGVRRLSVEMTAMADQAPQATLNGVGKLQKHGSQYGIVAEAMGPSLRNSGSGIPDMEFRSKLILPWNDLILTCVPRNSGNAAEYPEFHKMRTGINRNTKQNAHPRKRENTHYSFTIRCTPSSSTHASYKDAPSPLINLETQHDGRSARIWMKKV